MNDAVWVDVLESLDRLAKGQAELVKRMNRAIALTEEMIVQEELRSFKVTNETKSN